MGVKAELEKTPETLSQDLEGESNSGADAAKTRGEWLEIAVEIPGQRDDEAATVFLAEMLREALLADGEFARKLWINRRFHWRLYLDVRLHLYVTCMRFRADDGVLGSFDIAAFIIPPSPPLAHNSPRPTCDTAAPLEI